MTVQGRLKEQPPEGMASATARTGVRSTAGCTWQIALPATGCWGVAGKWEDT